MKEVLISIIVPVLNEADQIENLLSGIQQAQAGFLKEIIVVDGGSSDETARRAKNLGAGVIRSEKGRARQMNRGAREASGDILYFLHADSYPPKSFDKEIVSVMSSGYDFGCFRLKFDWDHPVLRFYSWFTRLKMTGVRFGDQSLFVKRQLFDEVGGFNENLTVMEDQEIYSRLNKEGQFWLSEKSVVTSARKYRDVGVVKLQFVFVLIWCGFYLGVSQRTLVDIYKTLISP